jgi:hypothetical protein
MKESAQVPKPPLKRDLKDRHLRITYPSGHNCAVASVESNTSRNAFAIAVFPCMRGTERVEVVGRTGMGLVTREVAREQLLELAEKLTHIAREL